MSSAKMAKSLSTGSENETLHHFQPQVFDFNCLKGNNDILLFDLNQYFVDRITFYDTNSEMVMRIQNNCST